MRLTLVHPCIGRRRGQPYIRTWQMEPLAPATIAGLTPKGSGIEVRFYDDRTESIPYDEPTDLVAMSVETYTAKRSYQIASEFRRRGIPVVMGGFHPTLVPYAIACFAGAFITDLAYWQTVNVMWETFSIWLITAGLVMAGLAVVAFLIDLIPGRRRTLTWPRAIETLLR